MATKLPKVKRDPLTNKAYGFPTRGHERRVSPTVVAVIHITGNPKNQGANAAQNERNFANRDDSKGPSAHFYINRDGGGIKAIDQYTFAAWSNGDVAEPNTANAGVQSILKARAKGYNANEMCGVEIENVGFATVKGQMTDAQIRRCGRIVARTAKHFKLPINRNTVLAHADINGEDRQNCPALPKLREETLDKIITHAKAFRKRL